jgi:hypothetical protein
MKFTGFRHFNFSICFFFTNQKHKNKKKEKKGEWGTVLAIVSFPKASSFLVGACSSYLQTNKQKKIQNSKEGKWKKKSCKGPCWSFSDGGSKFG